MAKLLERLRDASRSGVYRVRRADELVDALRGSDFVLARIATRGKEALMQALARELHFPEWFGANWDALADCLSDLSWRPAAGYVLFFDELPEGEDRRILLEVLEDAAAHWRDAGRPFFAVARDPEGRLSLAPLFREA